MHSVTEMSLEPDGARSWIVAGVSTAALVFTFGTPFSFGVIIDPLSEQFGIPRVALSTVFSIMFFTFYVFAGVLGIFTTRVRIRPVLLVSGGTTVILAPSLFVVGTYPAFVVVFAVLGTTLGVVFVTLASVVPQWFQRRRGLATGVLLVGTGVSLFVMPPIWNLVIARFGVRSGFLAVVGCSGVMFLLAGAVCRRPPWQGRETDGTSDLGPWLRRRLRSARFWYLFVGIGLSLAWYYLLAGYAIGLLQARGVTRTVASLGFGLIGGVSIVTRLTSGAIADRWGYVRTLLASVGVIAAGCVLLLVPNVASTMVALLVLGMGLGGVSTLYIPVLLEVFTPEKDTAIIGIFNVSMGVFAVGAPPVATALVESSDSYGPVVILTLAAPLAAYVLLRRGLDVG